MLNTLSNRPATQPIVSGPHAELPPPSRREPVAAHIARTLALVQQRLPLTRRVLHAGESVYRAGEPMQCLYLIHSGIFKTVNLSADGREQVVGLHFRGDWLGFDGIADAQHGCDAVAMDTGEVWCVRYGAVMQGCAEDLSLMALLNSAMSRQILFGRDSMLSLCTLPADARVADFLRYWSESLADRGMRNDQITLRMTRAEIGNYLGMKLETVSRALSRLAREGLIRFTEGGRREVQIPDVGALAEFVQRNLSPHQTSAPMH